MKTSNRKSNKRASTSTVSTSVINATKDVVRERVIALIDRKEQFEGTMTQLNRAITSGIRRSVPAVWPGSPSVLRKVLNKVVSSLRKSGVSVKFMRTSDHERTRMVVLGRR